MKKRWTVDIVFPVYYDNIDILEDSTIEVLKHVKKIQDSYLFKIIISVNGPKSNKIIEKAKSICRKNDSVSYIYIKNVHWMPGYKKPAVNGCCSAMLTVA